MSRTLLVQGEQHRLRYSKGWSVNRDEMESRICYVEALVPCAHVEYSLHIMYEVVLETAPAGLFEQ